MPFLNRWCRKYHVIPLRWYFSTLGIQKSTQNSAKLFHKGGIPQVSTQIYQIDNIEIEKVIKKYHAKRLKFALSSTQINELLDCAFENNYKHWLMIKLQLECGLRVGEVCNLRIKNLNLQEREIGVEDYVVDNEVLWHPKRNSVRILPISDEIIKELKRFLGKRLKKDGYVFESQKADKLDTKSVIRFINTYAVNCNSIARTIGSHALRRTYASFLFSRKIDLLKISKLLGHREKETTLKYLFEINDRDFDDVRRILKEMY